MPVTTFAVPVKGVGRKDYSEANEYFVEPVISSWQSVYLYSQRITVPAGGSVVTDVAVGADKVVLLYDFFASIPANFLIGLKVEYVYPDGTAEEVMNETAYQKVVKHISKGIPFFSTIRFTLDNYGDVDEDFRLGCSGLYTSLKEYYQRLAPEIPLAP